MMINHMDDGNDYGEITLDSTEPFAKKIIEHCTQRNIGNTGVDPNSQYDM